MTPTHSSKVLFEGDSPIDCYYTSEFRQAYLSLNDGEELPSRMPRESPEDPIPPPHEGYWGKL